MDFGGFLPGFVIGILEGGGMFLHLPYGRNSSNILKHFSVTLHRLFYSYEYSYNEMNWVSCPPNSFLGDS